jgi:hypothetical protein
VGGKDLEAVDIKHFVGEKAKESLGIFAAEQVLNKVDCLDKKIKGARACYEILCEYLHPNVGDYYAITTEWRETIERHQLKLIKKTLSLEGFSRDPTVDRVVLNKVYRLFPKMTELFLTDMNYMSDFGQKLEVAAQKHIREIIRINRKCFKISDLCPCCSGSEVSKCCRKNLNLDV